MPEDQLRIVFMGTPEFAVPSLKILLEHRYHIAAVVTVPDKPAGRGQKVQESAVKRFALDQGLRILQPEKLRDPGFIEILQSIKPDLQVVVAFRMLPESVWSLPAKGTFNLHASLLPQYRGAAPINWAIINGEKVTGLTTFFLRHEIDSGMMIFQEEMNIGDSDTAGDLHDRLMIKGAGLVLKTIKSIEAGKPHLMDQKKLIAPGTSIKPAPKIFREHCRINWTRKGMEIHNLIRGLNPHPGAWCIMQDKENLKLILKIYASEFLPGAPALIPGTVISDGKTYFRVTVSDGFISLLSIQLEGKKRLPVEEFLRGLQHFEKLHMVMD